jgi:hypothetical protein
MEDLTYFVGHFLTARSLSAAGGYLALLLFDIMNLQEVRFREYLQASP